MDVALRVCPLGFAALAFTANYTATYGNGLPIEKQTWHHDSMLQRTDHLVVFLDLQGQIEFRALVFIPSTMPFELTRDMFSPEGRAMRLYVKRVFIKRKQL